MSGTDTVSRVVKLAVDTSALTADQRVLLDRHAGTARAGWNWALAARNHHADERWAWLRERAADAVTAEVGTDGVDEAIAALVRDRDWVRDQRDAMPAHLRSAPTANVLDKQFTVESQDPDSRFAWWSTEKHGVSRFAVSTPLRELDAAFTRFYADTGGHRSRPARRPRKDGRPGGWPRFKKKGRATPAFAIFKIGQGGRRQWSVIDGAHRIMVPNLGSLRVHQNTKLLRRMISRGGVPKSVRFTEHAGRWYASVVLSLPSEAVPAPVTSRAQRTAGVVGVDLGVRTLAMLSTGEAIENPRHLRGMSVKLIRLQRRHSRQRGPRHLDGPSKGWMDTGRRIGRLQHHMALRRTGGLHMVTKRVCTVAATVAIEDLNVRGMSASTRPAEDPDEPGRWLPNGRAAKSGLNRSILDAAFGEFRRQLEYKAPWYGARVVVIDRFAPTSKICSACGTAKATLRLSERTYTCEQCGLVMDRDLNAARNIAALAASSPPSGGDDKRPVANANTMIVKTLSGKATPHAGVVTAASNGPPVPPCARDMPIPA